jgi:PAS domain S-box-containing protein/diguanylate cyclase (GGDEF)-like protein
MSNFFIDLIYNGTLLLSLAILYTTFPFKRLNESKFKDYLMALLISVVGILIMSNPFIFERGILLDSRSILLSTVGMFFPLQTTIISMIFMGLYRIYLGGVGTLSGIAIIITSGVIGIIWRSIRYDKVTSNHIDIGIEFLVVGVVVHMVVLLDYLLTPMVYHRALITNMAPSILIIFPLGNYLLSMLLYRSLNQVAMVEKIKESEQLFKTMFEQAPIGITLTESTTGRMLDVNQKLTKMLGLPKEEFIHIDWRSITHPDDIEKDIEYMKLLQKGEIQSYSMDKRYKCADGSYLWTNIAVSAIFKTETTKQRHFCMITDISDRKESEERILYAYLHDHLTGLPNQLHFINTLHHMKNEQQFPFILVIADINGFKIVNDAFSREVGDELLVNVGQIFEHEKHEEDYCARIGGDEFALIIKGKEELYTQQLIGRIHSRVESLAKNKVVVSLSFGVSIAESGVVSVDELLKLTENDLNQNKLHESPSSRSKALNTFIHTLHEKNPREELHSRRVSLLGARLAKACNMGPTEIAQMKTVGLLHDIGKISIDEAILNKKGPLDGKEWNEIKKHPEKGYRILLSVGELGELSTYVLSHHERIDGKGYPQGLKGDQIPLQSKIIAIVDSFDAMTAWRPYKQSLSEESAAKELIRCSGTQFDSALVSTFVKQVLCLDTLVG